MSRHSLKELALILSVVLFSAVLFWIVGHALVFDLHPVLLAGLVIASFVWVALTAFVLAIVDHGKMITLIVTLIPVTIIVGGGLAAGPIGGAILIVILLLVARSRIVTEINNRIKYSTFQTFYEGSKLLSLTFMIAVAGLTMAPLIDQLKKHGIQIPYPYIASVLKPLGTILPDTGADYESQLQEVLIDKKLHEELNQLAPDTRLSPIQINQFRQQIKSELMVKEPSVGQEQELTNIAQTMNQRLTILSQGKPILSALLIIILTVGVLKLFIPILIWPIILLIAGFVSLAKQSGMVYLSITQQDVERLVI